MKINGKFDKDKGNHSSRTESVADDILSWSHGSFDFCAEVGVDAPANQSVTAALTYGEFLIVFIALRDVTFAFPFGQTEQLSNLLLLEAKGEVEGRNAMAATSATSHTGATLVGSLAFHVVGARDATDSRIHLIVDKRTGARFGDPVSGHTTHSVIGTWWI